MPLRQLLALIGPVLLAQTPDVFRNPTAGFEMTKPADWHYITAAEHMEHLQRAKLDDQEFKEAMVKYASTPMVAISKFKEPYDDLNPSVKANVRPLGTLKGQSTSEIAKLILTQLQRAFGDMKVSDGPKDV